MKEFLESPVGLFVRDLIEGGISTAVAAVLALNLDVTSARGIFAAALAGFIGGCIAAARRRLVESVKS